MVSPSTATLRGKQIQLFTSTEAATWTTTGGSLFTDAAGTVPYTGGARSSIYLKAFNKGGGATFTVTATGSSASSAAVSITGVFPMIPHFNYKMNSTKRGKVVRISRSGKRQGRILGDGRFVDDFKLVFRKYTRIHLAELKQFWADHDPDQVFWYKDLFQNLEALFYTDSDLSTTPVSGNQAEFELAIAAA